MATTYSVASGSWTYRLYVTETATDILTNTSTVTCEMRIYRANSQWSYITNGLYALKVTINGVTQTSPSVYVNKSTSQPEVSVVTLTFTVPHNEDGTGVAQITYCQFQSLNGTSPASATLGSMPKNFTLTTIPRASDLSCNSPVTMGTTEAVTVTQKSTTFSHILYYSTDGETFTEIGRGTATATYNWAVPDTTTSLPNATSTTYTLRCYTYTNSTYEGTPLESTLSITANVPASYVPTISIGTITEGNANVPAGFPFLVGVSTLSIPTTAQGSGGSTIASRSVTANGETQTSANTGTVTFAMTKALSALSTVVNATTTDSRGRQGTATQTVTAHAYTAPTVEIDCTRCQSDGTIDALGEYVLVRAKWDWTSITNGGSELNSADINIKVDGTQTATYSTQTNSQTTYTQIAILPSMLATNQYTITAEISDEVMSASVSQVVTKATLPLSLFDDGNGIGVTIGRMATREGFNVTLDTTLLSGQNINLFDANNQQIDTMTTDDLFNGGGGLAKFVKGTPIDLYDTDGETVLYSRNPENLVFYDGESGEDVASNFIYANVDTAITVTTSWQYPSLVAITSKGGGFTIESGKIKCNKNGRVRVRAITQMFRNSSTTAVTYVRIDVNRTAVSNSNKYANIAYSALVETDCIASVTSGDYIELGVYTETVNGVTCRNTSTILCEYMEDYYITQSISESNTYSTSEIEIGRWIDGKPIYRKVIVATTVSGANTINTGISNIDRMIKWEGSTKQANTNVGGLSYYISTADQSICYYAGGSNQFIIRTGSSYGFGQTVIICEYTKTTD